MFIAVGDVVHDEDDRLLGTIASFGSATAIVMAANLANAAVDEKNIYNTSPIKLILTFEK